jgi:tetratricopeptide (TPR) repeat protein
MESHISKDEMVRVFSYGVTAAEVSDRLAHIVACSRCWDLAAEIVADLKASKDLVPAKRGRPPEWRFQDDRDALIVLMEIEERKSVGALRAKGWWAELRDLSPRDQVEKVNSVAAVQKKEVFEEIIQEAKHFGPSDPHAAEHLAMSAYLLVEHLPGGEFPERVKDGLRLSAMTVVANSRRLASNWAGARSAITEAQRCQARGKPSPTERAYLLSIHASLLLDVGQLDESISLMSQAAGLYQSVADSKGVATMKIKAGDALYGAGKPEEAIGMAEDALAILASDPEAVRLKLLARSIIIESMVTLGRPTAARRRYEATKHLYHEVGGRLTLLRGEYLEAKLLDALGHARESEKLFRKAIDGVTEMEVYRLSFLFRFAFFESLFKRDALGKAARLCEESIDLLQSTKESHSQMSQVWKDLLAAVKAEALKEYHLAIMRDYLVRHWASPASRKPVFNESGRE